VDTLVKMIASPEYLIATYTTWILHILQARNQDFTLEGAKPSIDVLHIEVVAIIKALRHE
jgi:hypothetical protein